MGSSGSSGGTNYAPPGGNQPSSYALSGSSSGYEKKWGATSPSTPSDYKPMGNTYEKKLSTTTGVPIVQIKEEKKDKSDEKKSKRKRK
jgi:hypothetical protein